MEYLIVQVVFVWAKDLWVLHEACHKYYAYMGPLLKCVVRSSEISSLG